MTEYPVQCFERNGEPYGRYVNSVELNSGPENHLKWLEMERLINMKTFRFPSGTIGKTYERGEVEVIYQYFAEWNGIKEWFYCNKEWFDAINRKSVCPTRQIFRLVISKTETATQPVEKEPETVEQASSEYADSQHTSFKGNLYRSFIAGANWQIQQLK